jgi:predicted amidohydrolase YtcJ
LIRQGGPDAGKRIPPVITGQRLGVHIGAGTDAHRVASYNPFTSLQWFLDGKTVGGAAIRGPEETPDRMTALRFYTLGSAWFSHDDDVRGSLEPGKLADLFVCEGDALADVARTRSLRYTMLDGRLYDAGTLAPADGRGGTAPRFFWTDMQAGLPAQTTEAGCAACR